MATVVIMPKRDQSVESCILTELNKQKGEKIEDMASDSSSAPTAETTELTVTEKQRPAEKKVVEEIENMHFEL